MKQLGIKHWYKDEDYLTASYRLASQPTVNIEGLVSGYTGPGGKTVLPGRAEAKMDFRLVPDMTREEAETKLKAHPREARLRRHRRQRQRRLQPDRDRREQPAREVADRLIEEVGESTMRSIRGLLGRGRA
jgi:acetylornithine deacetylase/succinyl-diaminopimelate desuccinylase-like protein